MNVCITGVAGLLGSRLAEYLIQNKEVTVVGVDDLSGGYRENIPEGVIFHEIDAGDKTKMEYLFEQYTFDYVYHFSAYAAEALSPFIRQFNYTNNLVVTANIVNLCIKYNIKRLVFTSSLAVYGEQEPPFHEDLQRVPVDPYGVAKAACERDIEIAGIQHNLDYCIIRPHNVFGRNQNIWDSYRNFIGIAIYKGMIGDPITIFGDGLQKRAFSCMDDCLEPFWKAATDSRASRQIINLGGIHESTILEVANIVAGLCNASLIYLPARHEVKYAWPTWAKSVQLLDFKHTVNLSVGIEDMWRWAQTQPSRERFIWKEYELDKGLYPYWAPEALKNGYWQKNTIATKLP